MYSSADTRLNLLRTGVGDAIQKTKLIVVFRCQASWFRSLVGQSLFQRRFISSPESVVLDAEKGNPSLSWARLLNTILNDSLDCSVSIYSRATPDWISKELHIPHMVGDVELNRSASSLRILLLHTMMQAGVDPARARQVLQRVPSENDGFSVFEKETQERLIEACRNDMGRAWGISVQGPSLHETCRHRVLPNIWTDQQIVRAVHDMTHLMLALREEERAVRISSLNKMTRLIKRDCEVIFRKLFHQL